MKVLIYKDKNSLEPIGGPTGYLYNLYKEIENEKINTISFIETNKVKTRMRVKQLFKKMPKSIKELYYEKKKKKFANELLDKVYNYNRKRVSSIDINKYDIIHFHDTLEMYMVKDSLENFNGKIIITSHSPKVYHQELIDRIPIEIYEQNKEKYENLKIIDEYAFNKADYIVFPCEFAEEPYYNTWKDYSKIKKLNKEKYRYLPTGIFPQKISEDKENIRKRYNIPQNAFVISYVGRHNTVKGYDKLKEIGQKLLSERKDIYFLIAGKEQPIKGIDHKRWIEVGWTNHPHDLVNASDIFLLPNKETYFDLILLEVMSIGKPVLLTNTGGNKYFKGFESEGLMYYDYSRIDDAVKIIKSIDLMKAKEWGDMNKKIFNENFTIDIFTKKYLEMLNSIYINMKK